MGRACCILGCPSGGDVPSHRIPKNPVLFQKWKSAIYSEKMKNMTDEQISKCAVCYRHFADDDYLVTFRVRKLKRGIPPSLNLPNKSAIDYGEPKKEPYNMETVETSDASGNICNEKGIMESRIREMEVSETADVALFEDLPDEAEFFKLLQLNNQKRFVPHEERFKQLQLNNQESFVPHVERFKQLQLNNQERSHVPRVERTNLTKDFKLYCQKRILRRKRAKLIDQQLALLRYKKQAEQYERTPTIQKLLSFLTSNRIASIKTRIRKSKYSPKVYVKEYHEIAKQRALGQL